MVGELSEERDRGGPAADVCPAPALRRHGPGNKQDLSVVQVTAGFGHADRDRPRRVDRQLSLDDGGGVAGAHRAGVGPSAHQQPSPVTTMVFPAPYPR
jgi:hypothetical protein